MTPAKGRLMTVDQFVDFVSACGPSLFLEEFRRSWHIHEETNSFPRRQRWEEWSDQTEWFKFELCANDELVKMLDQLLANLPIDQERLDQLLEAAE
jgi:hypothetical protein